MEFKKDQLKEHFYSDRLVALLRGCVLDLDFFAVKQWDKHLKITSVFRSGLQQVALCKAYKFKSHFRHCIWSAIDFSIRNLTEDNLSELERYAQNEWKQFCRLKVHRKGTAKHMHLELNEEFTDMNELWRLIANTKEAKDFFVG